MALIGRLFVILFAFLAACLVAGMIVVGAVLFPEFSDLGAGPVDQGALNIVLGFGFIFISGFALLPAMIVVLITEAFYVRGALTYAIGGGLVGLACYLGLVPFDTETLRFEGIVRRHLEIMTGAGIVAGLVYWMIAGRNAGAWREPPRPMRPPPPLPSQSPPLVTKRAAKPFHQPTASAKPRAMNRTGLFIALGLALVVGLLFGIFPELDLKLAACFTMPTTKSFPLKLNTLAAIARDGAMWIAWGLALPAIVALVVKLLRPDRPLLISGRAIVFLLVTLLLSAGVLTNLTFKSYWGRPRPVVVTRVQRAGPVRAVVGSARRLRAKLLVLLRRGRHRVLDLCARGADAAGMAAAGLCRGDRCSASSPACCGWRSAGTSSPTSRLRAW